MCVIAGIASGTAALRFPAKTVTSSSGAVIACFNRSSQAAGLLEPLPQVDERGPFDHRPLP
jgi:hypothetical protein